MENTRVCILTSVHPAFDTRIFHKEAASLVGAGYSVTLIAQNVRDETVDGIKIISLQKPKNRFFRILGTTWRVFLFALKQKSDVYHFHDPELISVGLILKLFTRSKIIYDIHEDVPGDILTKEWLPFHLRIIISKVFALLEKVSIPFFNAVIVAGNDIAKHLPVSKKIMVVKNFPLSEKRRKTNVRKTKEKEGEKPIILIYAGVLSRDRGIEEMVGAACLIKNNIKLLLVGNFDCPDFEVKIKKKAGERLEFIGQVPYEKVFEYLGTADIGLILFHPTPNNIGAVSGRNNKLFEYMAAGLPIIASDLSGWKEIVEGGGYGIVVNPLEPEDIANSINQLIQNPELRIKMGEKGRVDFLEKYNWDNEEKKLLEVYEYIMKK